MELQDARVLVVGASSGIGRAVALQAAAGGARVVLAARRADKLAEAAAEAGERAEHRGVRRAATRAVRARSSGTRSSSSAASTSWCTPPRSTRSCAWSTPTPSGGGRVRDQRVRRVAGDPGRAGAAHRVAAGAWSSSRRRRWADRSRAWVRTRPARPRSTSWCGRGGASTRRSGSATSRWATRSAPRCTSRGIRELLGELSPVWEARGYVHDNGPGAMSVDDCATAVLAAITSPVDLRYVLANPAPGSTMDVS